MSLRQAIDAKCRDCIHDPKSPGTWRQQVWNCTISTCSLWEHRARPVGQRVIEIGLGLPRIGHKKEAIA